MTYTRWLLLIFTVMLFTSCEEQNPHKEISLPEAPQPLEVFHLQRDLKAINFSQPAAARQQLFQKYGSFYCAYLETILRIGPCTSDSSLLALQGFVEYPDIAELSKEIEQFFPESTLNTYNQMFEDAFLRYHFFFPEDSLPKIVYMNSGFNCASFATQQHVGIGLDYFLGKNSKIVPRLPGEMFPSYIKEDMHPDLLVANTVKNFLYSKFLLSDGPGEKDLLHELVYHGKIMYLTDILLPEVPDSAKMAWSLQQTEWAKANEWNTWKELAQQDVMFGTSTPKNKKWFEFAPFTNAENVPQDSPPQLGIWMGWHIVDAYMKKNADVSPKDLLLETDAQKILRAYKPKS
jgi:hypothetical protein